MVACPTCSLNTALQLYETRLYQGSTGVLAVRSSWRARTGHALRDGGFVPAPPTMSMPSSNAATICGHSRPGSGIGSIHFRTTPSSAVPGHRRPVLAPAVGATYRDSKVKARAALAEDPRCGRRPQITASMALSQAVAASPSRGSKDPGSGAQSTRRSSAAQMSRRNA
jgi:hypothetical protein